MDGPTSWTSTPIATASARPRAGIRPTRSRICASARCDHAASRVRRRPCARSGRRRAASRPDRERLAAGRGPRSGRDRLLAMPYLERHHGGPRRTGRLEEARLQHGAARRAIDAARGRHRHPISHHQFRARRARGHRRRAAERAGQGAGRDALRGLPQPRAGHRGQAAEARLGDGRRQHVRALGHVGARRGPGDLRLSGRAIRPRLNEGKPMFLRNYWYVAAYDHEIGRRPLGRIILGEPIVFYRLEDGTPVALEDRCAHRHLPLSMGTLVGDVLQCHYHGLRYDKTGTCVRVPGQDTIPRSARVKSYPVVERYHWLWIWMGDPALADPDKITDFHWFDDPNWGAKGEYLHVKGNWQLIVDNLLDLTHLASCTGPRSATPRWWTRRRSRCNAPRTASRSPGGSSTRRRRRPS